MTLILLWLSGWLSGTATFYAPGVMDAVVDYRTGIGQIERCPACVGYVALLEPELIGRQVWLQAPGRKIEGPFLVADCAQRRHRADLARRGWVVDVDWETGQRWEMRGPLTGVQVCLDAICSPWTDRRLNGDID